jgi:hypothetical protein
MDLLNKMSNLQGNQKTAFRQVLKSVNDVVFVHDVCNFTDLTPKQVRTAFYALIKKGLIVNKSNHTLKMNQYTLSY